MLSSANPPSLRLARAIGYMAMAIVGYSMTPVMVGIASGGDTPLVYNAVMRFGYSISVAVFLFAFYGSLLRSTAVLKVLGRRLLNWHVVLIFLGQFEIGLLAWATRFVDISVATILMESWPILLVFLVGRWFTARDRYVKPTPALVLLLIAGFGGVALVILSQGVEGDGFYGRTLVAPFLGFLLALGAALCIALSGLGVSMGHRCRQRPRRSPGPQVQAGIPGAVWRDGGELFRESAGRPFRRGIRAGRWRSIETRHAIGRLHSRINLRHTKRSLAPGQSNVDYAGDQRSGLRNAVTKPRLARPAVPDRGGKNGPAVAGRASNRSVKRRSQPCV